MWCLLLGMPAICGDIGYSFHTIRKAMSPAPESYYKWFFDSTHITKRGGHLFNWCLGV